MFVEIKPGSRLFEVLTEFCTIIGEGWIQPRKEEGIAYFILKHPVNPQWKQLLVYLDKSVNPFAGGTIFIREPREGHAYDTLAHMPLVHYFSDPRETGRSIFPYAVDIHDSEVTYYYGKSVQGSTQISVIKTPKEVYDRFRKLFDEVNEPPWQERDNLNYDLPAPDLPEMKE